MDLKETIPEYINIERQCRVCIHARGPAFITPISPTCGGCTAARPTTVAVMVTGLQPTCTKNLEPDSAACAGTCTILFADCHTRAMLGPSQRETCSAVSHTGCCVPIPSLSLSLSPNYSDMVWSCTCTCQCWPSGPRTATVVPTGTPGRTRRTVSERRTGGFQDKKPCLLLR